MRTPPLFLTASLVRIKVCMIDNLIKYQYIVPTSTVRIPGMLIGLDYVIVLFHND